MSGVVDIEARVPKEGLLSPSAADFFNEFD